jgi:hypothetical protein
MATDAFGRLRTSEPFSTFNYYPSPSYADTSDNDVWVNDVSNGGIIRYDASNNLIKLDISGGGVGNLDKYAFRTTKLPMDYQPGKSRLIMMSGVMLTPIPTLGEQIFSRVGLINVASPTITDGVWFEVDGSNNTLNWCQSIQDGSGSYTVEKVADSSWNIDTFDGSGPSGKTLLFSNMNKVILIVIDQEWLGVGRLRCGFNINGVTYYAHAFTHNELSYAYTASPRQRLGYEILTGTNGTAPTDTYTLKQICCTSMSEGGFFPLGARNSIHSNVITPPSTGTPETLLMAIRLKIGENYKNGTIKPIAIDFVNTANNTSNGSTASYELRLLSRINGTDIGTQIPDSSFNGLSNSIVRYFTPTVSTIVINGGYTINSGFVSNRANTSFGSSDYETLLTRTICTQYDTLAIIVKHVNGTPTIAASIDFIESL